MSSQLQAILGESYLCEFMTNMKITCDAPRTVGSFCGRIDPKEVVETIRFRTYSGVDPRIPGRDLPPKEGIQLSLGLAAITLEAFLYEPDTRFNMSFNEQDIHIHWPGLGYAPRKFSGGMLTREDLSRIIATMYMEEFGSKDWSKEHRELLPGSTRPLQDMRLFELLRTKDGKWFPVIGLARDAPPK